MRIPTDAELRAARIDAAAGDQLKLVCPKGCGAMVLNRAHPQAEDITKTARCPRCGKRLTITTKDFT